MFARWKSSEAGIEIERAAAVDAPEQTLLVRYFAQVSMEGVECWSLSVDGAPELQLRDEDVAVLEQQFQLARYELGGAELSAAGESPRQALEQILAPQRVPVLERFCGGLVEAMAASLTALSNQPLQRFLESSSTHGTATAWLAQALVRIGRNGEADWNESAIEALRGLAPVGAELELDRVESALGHARVVLALCTDGGECVVCVDAMGGAAVLEDGDWLRMRFPASAAALLRRATEAMEIDLEAALALLDEALTLPEVDPIAHFHRGNVLHELERFDDAIVAFARAEDALSAEPRMLARGNRATLMSQLGDRDAALALLVQNTNEFPDSVEAWYALGLSLVKLGRHDESIAAETRAIELDDNNANAHYTIACAFALRDGHGDRDRAIEHVVAALACDAALRDAIRDDDDFATIRDDPRFRAALAA